MGIHKKVQGGICRKRTGCSDGGKTERIRVYPRRKIYVFFQEKRYISDFGDKEGNVPTYGHAARLAGGVG